MGKGGGVPRAKWESLPHELGDMFVRGLGSRSLDLWVVGLSAERPGECAWSAYRTTILLQRAVTRPYIIVRISAGRSMSGNVCAVAMLGGCGSQVVEVRWSLRFR